MSLEPTSDIVAQFWLRSLTFPEQVDVSALLPDVWDLETGDTLWRVRDFLTARTVGGNVDVYQPAIRLPIVTVDCWSRPQQQKNSPPWNRANTLAEVIRLSTYGEQNMKLLVLPTPYLNARVKDVSMIQEPRRIQDDPAGLARYTLDIQIIWASEGS